MAAPVATFDWYVSAAVGAEVANKRTATLTFYLSSSSTSKRLGVKAWLTDSVHGPLTGTAPSTISTSPTTGLIRVREVQAKKAWIFLLNSTGKMNLIVGYGGAKTWYLNIATNDGRYLTQSVAFT